MRVLASLTNRIFLASSLLAVISIAAAILVVNVRVTRDAEAGLHRELEDAAGLVAEWRTTLSENFMLAAQLIADAPQLKAAVATGDAMTVQPLAEEYRRQVHSDVFIVTDRQGRVLTLGPGRRVEEPPSDSVAVALLGRETVSYRAHPDGVLEIVTVPITLQPQIIGSLSVGFLFGRRRAEQFKRATDTEIAFAIGGRVLAGTLPAADLEEIAHLLPGTATVSLRGNEYLGLMRPLSATGSRADEASTPWALVLQSRSDRLRFLRGIHTALAVTALVAVLGAILLSYLVARTVTRPLAAISDGMREMAATGDLARRISLPAGNRDEDAELLASTFNRLTESVARFQREARQRERLSSLGRLSTVIAHEIRNPLMIIKAAVRTLRRESTNQEEVRQAAADIGEEVDRLNRIVGEVLDFARPIRFTYGDTDLAALCAQAAAAASAGDAYPAVHVVASAPVPVVTDAERLRGVLVNLLSNARQAVLGVRPEPAAVPAEASGAAHAAQGPHQPAETADVEIRVGAADGGRVRIEISDRGPGIPPDVLPRVFDPYFSTRRDGTGLGLAIARNVIDGLEGFITLSSEIGAGTRVRIDLPRVPDAAGQSAGQP